MYRRSTTINLLSNMGIVLLMFSIGLNLNLEKLKQLSSYIPILLSLEMPFMVVAGYLARPALGGQRGCDLLGA